MKLTFQQSHSLVIITLFKTYEDLLMLRDHPQVMFFCVTFQSFQPVLSCIICLTLNDLQKSIKNQTKLLIQNNLDIICKHSPKASCFKITRMPHKSISS